MIGIRDVSNYSSDHFTLRAWLLLCPTWYQISYLWGRRTFTIALPAPDEFRITDKKLKDMKAVKPTPTPLNCPPHHQWMSETLKFLIDEHAALRRNPRHNTNVARMLTTSIQRSLLVGSRRQAEKATEDIGTCLEPATGSPDLRGEYTVIKR